ncbi:MAG: autotransporter assembly complex protein TamA [Chromatiaceae bacterium]|nr:autotransporter assembly complex protein TamA [Candidatus Thioaporhodococcus sediminis]
MPQVPPLPSRLLAVLGLLFRAGLFTTSLFCASLLADTLPYDLKIKPTGDKAMDQALLDASLLASLREEAKAGAFALVARANDDLPRLDDVLRSFGYYDAYIDIRLDGLPLATPDLVARLEERSAAGATGTPGKAGAARTGDTVSGGSMPGTPGAIPVEVGIDLGPLYHIGQARLEGVVPASVHAAFTLAPGQPALASSVLAAGRAVLAALREEGYALAQVPAPDVLVNHYTRTMDVTYTADPGPRLGIGNIRIEGLDKVKEDYVRRRLGLEPGELFSPSRLERARKELMDGGVLASARIIPGSNPDPSGRLPLTLEVTERPPRVLRFAGAYSTDEGGSISTSWTHRNLLGRAERLTLRADVGTLGASYTSQMSYLATVAFVKPDFWYRDLDLNLAFAAVREFLEAYDRDAITASVALQRRFGDNLQVGLGLGLEQSRITQDEEVQDYNLAFLPLTLKYNDAGDLLDPRQGFRVEARAAPTQVLSGDADDFLHLRATGTAYLDLSRLTTASAASGRTILAGRLVVGRIFGASATAVPPDWRFYAGGGGSVRGFPYQSIGPETASGQPQGGSNLLETSIEVRQRLWGNWGAAVFVDTGAVSDENFPGTGGWSVGAGAGVRYQTPVGPVRLDLATPLNNDADDPAVQVYIGIGQAW